VGRLGLLPEYARPSDPHRASSVRAKVKNQSVQGSCSYLSQPFILEARPGARAKGRGLEVSFAVSYAETLAAGLHLLAVRPQWPPEGWRSELRLCVGLRAGLRIPPQITSAVAGERTMGRGVGPRVKTAVDFSGRGRSWEDHGVEALGGCGVMATALPPAGSLSPKRPCHSIRPVGTWSWGNLFLWGVRTRNGTRRGPWQPHFSGRGTWTWTFFRTRPILSGRAASVAACEVLPRRLSRHPAGGQAWPGLLTTEPVATKAGAVPAAESNAAMPRSLSSSPSAWRKLGPRCSCTGASGRYAPWKEGRPLLERSWTIWLGPPGEWPAWGSRTWDGRGTRLGADPSSGWPPAPAYFTACQPAGPAFPARSRRLAPGGVAEGLAATRRRRVDCTAPWPWACSARSGRSAGPGLVGPRGWL